MYKHTFTISSSPLSYQSPISPPLSFHVDLPLCPQGIKTQWCLLHSEKILVHSSGLVFSDTARSFVLGPLCLIASLVCLINRSKLIFTSVLFSLRRCLHTVLSYTRRCLNTVLSYMRRYFHSLRFMWTRRQCVSQATSALCSTCPSTWSTLVGNCWRFTGTSLFNYTVFHSDVRFDGTNTVHNLWYVATYIICYYVDSCSCLTMTIER